MNKRESELFAEVERVYGPENVDKALSLAIEAGKLGIRESDLDTMVSAWSKMRLLGIEPEPGEPTNTYGLRIGVITNQQIEDALKLDILGMRDNTEPPDDRTKA